MLPEGGGGGLDLWGERKVMSVACCAPGTWSERSNSGQVWGAWATETASSSMLMGEAASTRAWRVDVSARGLFGGRGTLGTILSPAGFTCGLGMAERSGKGERGVRFFLKVCAAGFEKQAVDRLF